MKILLFGGAFDPPHLGHISILKSALNYESFDKAIIMPTGTPTHKNNCIAPFDVRKYLAEKAFCPLSPIVEVSDYEGRSLVEDYTYRTIEYLNKTYENSEIYMLIGGDSLLKLKEWFEYKQIIKACRILSFARQENEEEKIKSEIKALSKDGADIQFIKSEVKQLSSTQIRLLEQKDSDVGTLVGADINEIIEKYNLYSSDNYKRQYGTSQLLVNILLDEKRRIHTLNVEKLAVELSNRYGLDEKKARLAALLHDIMKNAPQDILLHRAQQSDIITKINAKPLPTLHGYAAADYVQKEIKLFDEDIIAALKSHTCARKDMQDFEKVIYLADMLCEEREFLGKEDMLKCAFISLDKAMEQALEQNIEWLKARGKVLDIDSVNAFAYFKGKNKKKES